jgi:uncharacterized damage-inducible protein DinB
MMNELERALTADSFAAPPSHILEGLDEAIANAPTYGAPHTIYSELWHIAYWQQVSLDWIAGVETPIPAHASFGFPDAYQTSQESWPQLCDRFFAGMKQAAVHAADEATLEDPIRCPSLPGEPTRIMSIRDQLINLAGHNAYHFGRIVLLRQLAGAWPPSSGGFTW